MIPGDHNWGICYETGHVGKTWKARSSVEISAFQCVKKILTDAKRTEVSLSCVHQGNTQLITKTHFWVLIKIDK